MNGLLESAEKYRKESVGIGKGTIVDTPTLGKIEECLLSLFTSYKQV